MKRRAYTKGKVNVISRVTCLVLLYYMGRKIFKKKSQLTRKIISNYKKKKQNGSYGKKTKKGKNSLVSVGFEQLFALIKNPGKNLAPGGL